MNSLITKKTDMGALSEYEEYLWSKPRLRYLFFELMDECNLSCAHCGSNCTGESESDDDTARVAVHTVRSFLQEYPDAFDAVEWIIPDRKLSFLYTKAILGIV